MKAVGYRHSLPIHDASSLIDLDAPRPTPSGHDLLVRVLAVSVNPVDAKMRLRSAPSASIRRPCRRSVRLRSHGKDAA